MDSCLKTSIPQEHKNNTRRIRTQLKNNQSVITISDFGAGSKKMKLSRKVSSMYKYSAIKGSYADLLYRLSNFYKPNAILELGTHFGVGTFCLSEGNPNAQIVSVDACSETQKIAKQHIKNKNIQFIQSTFDVYLSGLSNQKFDLIYIDGDHRGKALLKYLQILDNFSHDDTIFVLDDIRWSKDMLQAWNDIIVNTNFHLTLDLFKMGIIVKKSSKEKEHFVLKFNNVLTSL